MRTYNLYFQFVSKILMLFVVLQFLSGCARRPLEEEIGNIATIPFKIDWSKSSLKVEKMNRATIRVFPHDGSAAYDFRLQENLTEAYMPLAIGKYSFVIFNETIDSEDWNTLIFKGIDKYDEFLVTTNIDSFEGLSSKGEGEEVHKVPELLASWSIDEFEVTHEMIAYTHALSKGEITKANYISSQMSSLELALKKTMTIEPVPIVKTINILARVQNLSSAQRSSGAIKGATESIQMNTRLPNKRSVTHIFVMNGRKYDDPDKPLHGTIGASILVFDVKNYEELKCEFTINFLLNDGTLAPGEVFDVTNDMTKEDINININIGFDVPEERPDDRPIILPSVPIGGGNVHIDDWDKIVVPMR